MPVTSSVCLLDVSDHLPPEQRSRFKTLDDNMDFLSQELRRDVITDYLRQRDLLTEDQHQHGHWHEVPPQSQQVPAAADQE